MILRLGILILLILLLCSGCTRTLEAAGQAVYQPFYFIDSVQNTQHEDPNHRLAAYMGVNLAYTLDGPKEIIIPVMLEGLKDEVPSNRWWVAIMLSGFEEDKDQVVPALIEAVDDESNKVKAMVISSLGMLHPDKETIFPVLASAFSDRDPDVKLNVLKSLSYYGPDAVQLIDPVARCLDHADRSVRKWAAVIMGGIGPDASDYLPKLKEMAEGDGDYEVRMAAYNAVEKIEGEEA